MATKIVTNVTTGETWEEELTAEEISWLPSESQHAAEDLEYLRMVRNGKLQMCFLWHSLGHGLRGPGSYLPSMW